MKDKYKKELGKKGELIAEKFLIKNGYKIVCKNFYTPKGEIDIIAEKNNEIIFIEVKTRTSLKFGTPAMAINYIKKKHIKLSAKIFLYLNQDIKYSSIRFDVIEVFVKDNRYMINHIKNAI